MGSARVSGGRLLGFLTDAAARGTREALRALNLESLAGRPIEEIFLGLLDYVCPDGGSVDEGIARQAFIETIADLPEVGISDLESLSADQMQIVFEIYATNSIDARICNDIGAKIVTLPNDPREVRRVQSQLKDFIRRAVSDALTSAQAAAGLLTAARVNSFVTGVYREAFEILQAMGEAEAAE